MSSLRSSSIPLFKLKVQEKGRIKDIKEIIVRLEGLPTCLNGQIVDLGDDVKGIIMGFDENDVLCLVLGEPGKLKMGKEIMGTSEPFKIPVGEGLLGRMVTALATPCDSSGELAVAEQMPVFRDSPPIVHRDTINEFIPTGTKIIDMLIPLAKGQRQLILGDRMTGKTTIGVDAVLSQKGRNMVCIYCCIGKSMSSLEKIVHLFHENDVLDFVVMVVATDNAPVGEQYIVPFSAATIGDWFASKGRDVLVVFDDLTKHAWSYRQLSLLLERPPGREAYPGDIFYVQTQLMEKAGKFNEKHGKGSMTFLGIAETLQGDMTGYIPSNLVSMCDGQVCLSSTVFAEGFRPAIDISLSLSIVGGRTQPPLIKKLAGPLRSDFARYNELIKLSKLSSGLSGEAAKIINRGEAIRAILQQPESVPVMMGENILMLCLLDRKDFLEMTSEAKNRAAKEVAAKARETVQDLLGRLAEATAITADLKKGIDDFYDAFFAEFKA